MLNPAEPKKTKNAWIDTSKVDKKRIYYRLCIIRYFLFSVSPNNNFNEKLSGLLADFLSVDIAAMGFTHDWKNVEIKFMIFDYEIYRNRTMHLVW